MSPYGRKVSSEPAGDHAWTRYRVFLIGFLPIGAVYTVFGLIRLARGEEVAGRLVFGLAWIAIGLLVQAVLIERGRRRERDDVRDGEESGGGRRVVPWSGASPCRRGGHLVSDVPDLGPMPQRVAVSAEQAGCLVAEQFPEWAALPVTPVENGGWDNRTFHLGDSMLLRLPSAEEYALAVEKEHRWLPELAPRLPLPVPVPLAKGRPGAGYPFAWSVYGWIDGTPATFDSVVDPGRLAADLADFIAALQRVDASEGPRPGKHNWFRGATLRTYEAQAQDALDALHGRIDDALARELWAQALEAPWDGVDVWFHGDLARGNLLLTDGQLSAVIDFGTCGVGDPACDRAIAWTLLSADGRNVFRERLDVDDATWSRGRGWALWKTLVTCADSMDEDDADARDARRVLAELLGDRP